MLKSIINRQPLFVPNTHQLIIFNLIIAMACIYTQLAPAAEIAALIPQGTQSGSLLQIAYRFFHHHNAFHMILNLSGLTLTCIIFKPNAKEITLVSTLTLLLLFGFTTLQPSQDHVGISGIIHSLVAYLSIKEALINNRAEYWFVLLGLIAKVVNECLFERSEILSWIIDGDVSKNISILCVYVGAFLIYFISYPKPVKNTARAR